MVIHCVSGLPYSQLAMLWCRGALIIELLWIGRSKILFPSQCGWQLQMFWHWRRWREVKGLNVTSPRVKVQTWSQYALSRCVCVGDSWSSSNVAVCQQQKFYGHPVGERVMSEWVSERVSEEVQLYYSFLRKDLWPALIYLHINTLSISLLS
jgi:hypothetical protein